MKKFVVLLLVAMICGSQMISAQVRSCVTYDSKRDLNGFKQVILTWKDPFIKSKLWPAYVDLVNNCLQKSKIQRVKLMVITSDIKGITFILNHSVEYENSYFNQSDYLNGIRINNQLQYRNIYGNPSNWVVFEYEDVNVMYAKIFCANPQQPIGKMDSEENFLPVAARSPMPVPTLTPDPVLVKKDTVYVEIERQQEVSDRPERSERYTGNNYYINNSLPYGYYGVNYYGYYRYFRYNGCNNYNGCGNGHYNSYAGNNNRYTSNNHNYTSNNNYTGGSNYSTSQSYGSTGRRDSNTGQGHMSTGRGDQNSSSSNQGGGRSNVSSSNYGNQTSSNVGRSNSSFSSGGGSYSRGSANTGGGQGGRR